MISREAKEKILKQSGLFEKIKRLFYNKKVFLNDKYIMLIADYIDALNHMSFEGGFYLDSKKVMNALPDLLKNVSEMPIDTYGSTDNKSIIMNSNNDYETNKLFFFHELTHAIQTRIIDGHEECGLYNGDTGMFLTEGMTQFTAEILYHMSNGTNLYYRNQNNSVRGLPNHTPYSALSQYQLNGNIIMLMSYSFGIPLNQILALGFISNGRYHLKQLYESFSGYEGKFEEFMFDLEKIYSIDKLIIKGYSIEMNSSQLSDIVLMNRKRSFKGNINVENELINKIERELAYIFITNNSDEYIRENYEKFALYLTTEQLKGEFNKTVHEILSLNAEL